MTVLYVASDQQGAGKTALCATLAHILARQDRKVAAFKPLTERGAASDTDAAAYRKLLGAGVEGWPIEAPSGGLTPGALDEIKGVYSRLSDGQDVVIVEGSSALSPDESRQVAEALDAKVVVITQFRRDLPPSQLRTLSNAFGDRLIGFVVNGLTRYLGTETRTRLLPSMRAEGLATLGIVPEDRRLLGVSVSQLVEHLNGRVLVDEGDMEALVEYLMVGGWSLDPGELYFSIHENRAVIARGDRPDIQMAALGTLGSTACLVATCGIEPIEYVQYEAEQEEVPLVLVETDTLTTMSALNTLIDRARFDHPLKLQRFAELLQENLDLSALFSQLGIAND